MLLGIYDDLLLSSQLTAALAAARNYKFFYTGWPRTPNTNTYFLTSTDLINFQATQVPIKGYPTGLAFGNDMILVLGYSYEGTNNPPNQTFRSADGGQTFTAHAGPPGTQRGQTLCFGKGLFVAGSNDGSAYAAIYTSPDGLSWTSRAVPWKGTGVPRFVPETGRFVYTGYDVINKKRAFAVSDDGISWARGPDIWPSGPQGSSAGHFSYEQGLYVIGGQTSNIADVAFSSDLVNWTRVTIPWAANSGSAYTHCVSIRWFKGAWYALGRGGSTVGVSLYATSTNLKDWLILPLPAPIQGAGAVLHATDDRMALYTVLNFPNDIVYVEVNGVFRYSHPSVVGAYFTTDGRSYANLPVPPLLWNMGSPRLQ